MCTPPTFDVACAPFLSEELLHRPDALVSSETAPARSHLRAPVPRATICGGLLQAASRMRAAIIMGGGLLRSLALKGCIHPVGHDRLACLATS